jgi:hypothetical protein
MSLSPGGPAPTPGRSQSAPAAPESLRPPGMFGGFGGRMGQGDGTVPRGRSRVPIRLVVGALCLFLLFGTATHIGPAIRAGLHDGTRGEWVATTRKCVHSACVWEGKFVSDGHVLVTGAQYEGQMPQDVHAGSSTAALYTGGSTVFPANGSDLWISLLVAMVLSLLGLYWAVHRYVIGYFRKRRDEEPDLITAPRH